MNKLTTLTLIAIVTISLAGCCRGWPRLFGRGDACAPPVAEHPTAETTRGLFGRYRSSPHCPHDYSASAQKYYRVRRGKGGREWPPRSEAPLGMQGLEARLREVVRLRFALPFGDVDRRFRWWFDEAEPGTLRSQAEPGNESSPLASLTLS